MVGGLPISALDRKLLRDLWEMRSQALAIGSVMAAGVVMFNRFYSPDLDMETLEVTPRISLSSTTELRLPLRWIGIGREFLRLPLAG